MSFLKTWRRRSSKKELVEEIQQQERLNSHQKNRKRIEF